jgi:long-chain acyl-CoA synthetase
MMTRLFDLVRERSETAPDETLLVGKESGVWREYSAREVWETSGQMAAALNQLGVANSVLTPDAQEKIAIISPSRPEWVITDLAVQRCGGVLTPIYPTIAAAEFAFIMNEAGIKKLFIGGNDIARRYDEVIKTIPTLEHIYVFDEGTSYLNWNTLRAARTPADDALEARITTETLATIIYTSGTTGDPKGVMLSHRNILSNVIDCMPVFTFAKKGEKALSFLPLNHIFERMVTYIYMHAGLAIWYAESMESIGANLVEVKPLVFTTVPRLLEKVYERILSKGMDLKGIKRMLFFWSLDLGKKYDNINRGSLWYRIQLAIANKLVFSKWRDALGGNVKAIVTGSAACQERLIRIFSAANVTIMEGYGLTETSPVLTVNHLESENRRIGTIGAVIQNVEVKLADDGEILCKGPNIMMGYYHRPDLTAEAMIDGWFHTGDIGQWIEGRFLKITDRKKEIFKTSGGKYVAPQPVENKMRESPYIEQIMLVGADRKYVAALIVPSFMQVRKFLKDSGKVVSGSNAEIVKMPEVEKLIKTQVAKYNSGFGHIEQIKKFTLLPEEWTIQDGELTPSLKVKRKVILQKYAEMIEGMYEQTVV